MKCIEMTSIYNMAHILAFYNYYSAYVCVWLLKSLNLYPTCWRQTSVSAAQLMSEWMNGWQFVVHILKHFTLWIYVLHLWRHAHVHIHSIKHNKFYWHTLSCRSTLAPAFTSSGITSVLPFPAAIISAENPSCVMTVMCCKTHTLKLILHWHHYTHMICTSNALIHIFRCKG